MIMKKLFSILFVALALCFVSCEKVIGPGDDVKQELAPDATLTLGFGVPQDPETKAAWANDPTIESIHVFIFDEEGHLLQVRKATFGAVTRNYTGTATTQTVSYWKVAGVMMANEKRILHFVANLADDQVPAAGSEKSIFQTLATSFPNASYWQKVELPNIIPYVYKGGGTYSYVDESGIYHEDAAVQATAHAADWSSYTDVNDFTVNVGDYIDSNSAKIVNGTGYFASDETSSRLTLIPMVRNFARIDFTNNWSQFTLKKIALVNAPKAGLVAPFDGSSFAAAYSKTSGNPPVFSTTPPTFAEVKSYVPLLPAEGIDTGLDADKKIALPVSQPYTDAAGFITASNNKASLFVYERGIPTSSATSVLVGGVLTGATDAQKDADGNTWFKIEIADVDGAYFPMYRDFSYDLTVTSIDPTAVRHASAEEALKAAPVGDISNSTETATLTQITDGKGLSLWVEYIDKVDMTGGRALPLIYTFVYESGSSKTYFCAGDSDRVTFTREPKPGTTLDFATTETVVKKGVISSTSNREYLSKVPDSNYTWYLAEVTLNAPGEGTTPILQSDIVVEGAVKSTDATRYTKKLSRRVTYTVMGQAKLGLMTSGVGSDAIGQQTTLTITLPNTLGPSVFPMTLKIEAKDNNLAPVDNLSVESGKSAFNPDGLRNTYYFLKTISYSDYQAAGRSTSAPYQFPCVFKTTKATGNTPVTQIMVTQKLEDNTVDLFKGGADAQVDLKVGSASTNN